MIKKSISKKMLITRNTRPPNLRMNTSHYHDGFEIYCLVKGNVRYFLDNKIFDLVPGDVILIPPNTLHKTSVTSQCPAERLLIAFTPGFLNKTEDDHIFKCFNSFFVDNPGKCRDIMEKMESEYAKKDEYTEELIKNLLCTLLIGLSRNSQDVKRNPSASPFVEKIIKYINDNYGTDLSLQHLSEIFSISKNYLSKLFKTETGFGLNEYITIIRMKRAEHLLISTNMSISEVATECGIHDSNYFSTVFKKLNGLSPLQYKKTAQR